MTTALSTHLAVSWWQAAYCRGAAIETFFPLPGDEVTIQRALSICGRCPVRIPCRRYALSHRERHGIWGGLTEETRATLMRIGPPAPTRGSQREPAVPSRSSGLESGEHAGELAPARDAQAGIDPVQVGPDGAVGDEQAPADLPVAQPL